MDLGLKGKSAIITGAGRGLGKAVAVGLVKEGVSDLVIFDVFQDRIDVTVSELKAMGCRALGIKCDITDLTQVNAAVAQALSQMGKIDILVNSAGGSNEVKFTKSTREGWEFAINLCVYGTFNCTRAVINHMVERKSGKIVNVGSDAGRVGEPYVPAYSAAKGGIIAFTKALAKEVGDDCINVNCVCPGTIDDERTQERLQARAAKMGFEASERLREKALKLYPLGRGLQRVALPEEVADLIIVLCSERATYVTGQTISVSGGYAM